VAHLLKARTVEPEKQSLIGNGYVTCNNEVTVGSGVYVRSVPRLSNEGSLEMVLRRVRGWCEMAASL
jgi:hypothetical protein